MPVIAIPSNAPSIAQIIQLAKLVFPPAPTHREALQYAFRHLVVPLEGGWELRPRRERVEEVLCDGVFKAAELELVLLFPLQPL